MRSSEFYNYFKSLIRTIIVFIFNIEFLNSEISYKITWSHNIRNKKPLIV